MTVAVKLSHPLYLTHTFGCIDTIQIHEKENLGLKAAQVKHMAEEKYSKLSPGTRQAIKGMIVVAKMAAKAASGV